MTKKACCCEPGGTYIAIPCKAFATIVVSNNSSTTIFPNLLNRPNVNGNFDSSRDVLYISRGGGGGANSNTASKGGNAAYAEYKINAQLNYKILAGAGGTAGNTGQNSTGYAGGGVAYTTAGMGGGGSVLGINATATSHSGAIVAGGGGSGRGVVGYGGHGGITSGVIGSGLNGGKGASQTSPGAPGGGNATAGNVTRGGRGAFQTQTPFNLGLGGGGGGGKFGGGGGGDSSGGGGGSSTQNLDRIKYAFDGSDDGPGVMCNPFISRYAGFGGNRKSGAKQNGQPGGIENTNPSGLGGEVVAYWIDRWCPCGDAINDIPTGPLFLCLNQAQYDYLIDQAGPDPSGFRVYGITFTLGGESYLLIPGTCPETCESVFKSDDPNTMPEDIKWAPFGECTGGEGALCDAYNTLYGGGIGGFYSPCCRYLFGTRQCKVPGFCASCGCDEAPQNVICCDPDKLEDYPDTYIGIYKGYYYLISKTQPGWFEWGTTLESLNAKKICVEPVYTQLPNGVNTWSEYIVDLCSNTTNECTKIVEPDVYEKCCIVEPDCLNFIFTGETCVAEWWNSFPCTEISGGRCIPTGRRQDISMSGILTTYFSDLGYSAPMGLPVDPVLDGAKLVTYNLSSHPPDNQAEALLENERQVGLTITYQCLPPNFDITNPSGIPLPVFYSTPDGYTNISMCATNGNFPEAGYIVKIDESKALKLSKIASAFNSMSAPFTMEANAKVWYSRRKENSYNCGGDYIDWATPEYSLGGTVDNPTAIVKFYVTPLGYHLKQTASAFEDPKDLPGVGSYAERYTETRISQWDWEENYSNLNSHWGPWISRCGYVSDNVGTADPTYLCKVRIDCDQTDGSASYNWCVWPAGLCVPCQETDLPNATTVCQDNVSTFTFNIF